MSSFRNISHVDASELFQVGRIEDIKNIIDIKNKKTR